MAAKDLVVLRVSDQGPQELFTARLDADATISVEEVDVHVDEEVYGAAPAQNLVVTIWRPDDEDAPANKKGKAKVAVFGKPKRKSPAKKSVAKKTSRKKTTRKSARKTAGSKARTARKRNTAKPASQRSTAPSRPTGTGAGTSTSKKALAERRRKEEAKATNEVQGVEPSPAGPLSAQRPTPGTGNVRTTASTKART